MDEFVAARAPVVSERTIAIAGTAIRANFRWFRIPGKASQEPQIAPVTPLFGEPSQAHSCRLPSRNLAENAYQSREIIGCHLRGEQRSKGELNHGGNL